MAGIGGITCTFVRGQGTSPKNRTEVWTRPGIDGHGAMVLGLGDSPYLFTAVAFGTAAAVATWQSSIEALQGTVVTIVDDWNTTWTNMLITTAANAGRTPRINHDGNGVCRGEVRVEGVKLA